jgi:tetratricopeptide (TPR) repeat protein
MEIMPEMQIEPGLDLVSESVAAEIPESVAETGIPEIPSGEETISSAEEQVDESILADASAAAAAAAIGIPLYAEHAANRGVTESLPRIDMEETAEETVAVSETDVAAETEAEVSAALEEIIVGEIQPVPTSEPEVETLAEAVSEQETIVEPEVVEEVSSIATQESAEEVTVVEPEFVEESVSMVEPEQVEEVPEPVMETFESVFEEQIAPVVVDGKDYETVYEQALQAIQSGEVEKALPALSSLVTAEQKLDEVIKIVDTTLKEYPTDFNLWVVLGDAYGRNGNLQNALDAYTKAEEYLQ